MELINFLKLRENLKKRLRRKRAREILRYETRGRKYLSIRRKNFLSRLGYMERTEKKQNIRKLIIKWRSENISRYNPLANERLCERQVSRVQINNGTLFIAQFKANFTLKGILISDFVTKASNIEIGKIATDGDLSTFSFK